MILFMCVDLCNMCIVFSLIFVFFFKQKTAYEMRISDWSSDVCSSDLVQGLKRLWRQVEARGARKTMCRQQLGWPWRHPFILPYRAPRSPQRPIYAHLRSLVRSRLGSTVTPGRSRRVKGPEAA